MKAFASARCSLLLGVLLLATCGRRPAAEAKFVGMRPLSAAEVYRLLHERGRSAAVPQGRVVTQGMAAMAGFALGLSKALGGVLLYDIITANVTAEMLNEAEAAENGGATNSNNGARTQEICFSSRMARSVEEAEAIREFYNAAAHRVRGKGKLRKSQAKRRRHRPQRRQHHKKHHPKFKVVKRIKNQDAESDIAGATATAAGGTAGVTQTALPTTTTANTGVGGGTNIDTGTATGTSSSSTTMTSPEQAINCVVLEK